MQTDSDFVHVPYWTLVIHSHGTLLLSLIFFAVAAKMFGDVDELKYGPHLKTVRLKRRSGQSFGFALRGGREHKIGFFVTQVQPGSESERQGLSVRAQCFS